MEQETARILVVDDDNELRRFSSCLSVWASLSGGVYLELSLELSVWSSLSGAICLKLSVWIRLSRACIFVDRFGSWAFFCLPKSIKHMIDFGIDFWLDFGSIFGGSWGVPGNFRGFN